MGRFFRAAILMACFFYAGSAFADGGTCPSDADHLSSSESYSLVTLASLGITNCYYISAAGSDSNAGTKASPWAHLPGMSTWTGSHTPAAGEGYIFRGGDTWSGTSIGITWNWAGTSSNPIYIGVDKSWYSGGSWNRPIWSCGHAACTGSQTGNFFYTGKSYVILDNIELTGLLETSTYHPNYVSASGTYDTVENLYVHGWSHDATLIPSATHSSVAFSSAAFGSVLRYIVEDGSDTSDDMMYFTHGATPTAYGNYIRYVQTGIDGCGDNWHDNLVEYFGWPGGGHQDGLYQYGPCYATTVLMYNNVVRHVTWSGAGGAPKLWLSGNDANAAIGYAFNNVLYDNIGGNIVDTGGHFGVNYGTWYIFNNTVQCGTDTSMGVCTLGDAGNKSGGSYTGGTMALYLSNNHWIQSGTASPLSCVQATWTCSTTTELSQTLAQANAQGHTDASTYAFQPTSSSGSTVGAGANENSSLCSAISAINSNAASACQNDTSYACTYNSTAHTVSCPMRTAVARPTGAWDVGAYQFSTTLQASAPKPPQGLTASVQ